MEGQEQNLSDQPAVMSDAPPPVPPQVIPYATPIGSVTSWGVFRVGSKLFVPQNAQLPPNCVKCNTPVEDGPIKRTYYYYHPAVLLLILVNILILAIVALIIRKKGVIYVHVCPKHRQSRRMWLLACLLLVIGGLGMVVGGILSRDVRIGVAGVVVIFSGAIAAIFARELYATKIDKDALWMKGAGREFLASIPTAPWSQ